jgi:hypothetical protein
MCRKHCLLSQIVNVYGTFLMFIMASSFVKGQLGFHSWQGYGIFCCHVQTSSGAHPASYPVGACSSRPMGKLAECEADHSPWSRAKVKNVWSYTTTSPYIYGVELKHMDITLIFYDYKIPPLVFKLNAVHYNILTLYPWNLGDYNGETRMYTEFCWGILWEISTWKRMGG